MTSSRVDFTSAGGRRVGHGKPTFRGTRVMVSDVLEQVANGVAWETIIEEWNRSVTKHAIREAV